VQSKLLFEKEEEEEDDIFEDAHFTAFCISSFLRERERVGRTALKCKCKKATTDRKLKRNKKKRKQKERVYLGFEKPEIFP